MENTFNAQKSVLADKMQSIKNGVTEKVGSSGSVLLTILIILWIIFIIVFIVYRITRPKVNITRIKNIVRLYQNENLPKSYDVSITSRGQDRSIGFWMYLNEFENQTHPKMIVSDAVEGTDGTDASYMFFLNNQVNKLYFCIKTIPDAGENLETPSATALMNNDLDLPFLRCEVEFIPMQRWVHIVATVHGNTVAIYLDGDLYSVTNINSMTKHSTIFDASDRKVFIGCSQTDTLTAVTRGFVSNVIHANYGLEHDIIKREYRKGPVHSSFLNKLGINIDNDWGLRNPIYKKEDTVM